MIHEGQRSGAHCCPYLHTQTSCLGTLDPQRLVACSGLLVSIGAIGAIDSPELEERRARTMFIEGELPFLTGDACRTLWAATTTPCIQLADSTEGISCCLSPPSTLWAMATTPCIQLADSTDAISCCTSLNSFMFMCVLLGTCLSNYLSVHPSIHPCTSICPCIQDLSVCLLCIYIYRFICLATYLSV